VHFASVFGTKVHRDWRRARRRRPADAGEALRVVRSQRAGEPLPVVRRRRDAGALLGGLLVAALALAGGCSSGPTPARRPYVRASDQICRAEADQSAGRRDALAAALRDGTDPAAVRRGLTGVAGLAGDLQAAIVQRTALSEPFADQPAIEAHWAKYQAALHSLADAAQGAVAAADAKPALLTPAAARRALAAARAQLAAVYRYEQNYGFTVCGTADRIGT
jgi:hypothetical protein